MRSALFLATTFFSLNVFGAPDQLTFIYETNFPRVPTLVVHLSTQNGDDVMAKIPAVFKEIQAYMNSKGIGAITPPFARWTKYVPPSIDAEVGYTVNKEDPGQGDIVASEISASQYAIEKVTGPYSGFAPAYDAIHKWINDNHHAENGAPIEFYLNDPSTVSQDKLETTIYYPVK